MNKKNRDKAVSDWWATEIIDVEPGKIHYHGYAIEDLIGRISFTEMIWLMIIGELPKPGQAALLDAALMSAVDHGPHAPSIAIARIAATCGVGLNNAIASAVNVLGDVHGGAGEQAMQLYQQVKERQEAGDTLSNSAGEVIDNYIESIGYIPGFGHRFHPRDPRSPRLLELVDQAALDGVVNGCYAAIGRAVEEALMARKGKLIPMNIDGATAVIYAELGFAPPLARGLFCLSRSVGILSHAWEQTCQGGRNKGPIPRDYPITYRGRKRRNLKLNEE